MSEFLYNNNPLLKKLGTTVSYTKEQVEELIRCKEDPIYFIETYCKIVSLDSEEPIPFKLFGYQKKFIKIMHENRRAISIQPRQSGKCIESKSLISIKIINKGVEYELRIPIGSLHELYKCKDEDEAEILLNGA